MKNTKGDESMIEEKEKEKTRAHSFSVPVSLIKAARKKAIDDDITLSALLRKLLRDYVAGKIDKNGEKGDE